MVNHSVYTPYTRITHLEKARIVRFIRENAGHDRYTAEEITEAVECAVKERPSFGGFILTAIRDGEMLGVVVVSHTGTENVMPRHRLTLLAIDQRYRQNGVAHGLIEKAVEQSGGDLALQLPAEDEQAGFFEKMGFQKRFVEMRFK